MKNMKLKMKKWFLLPLLLLCLSPAAVAADWRPLVHGENKEEKIEILTGLKEKYKIEKRHDLTFLNNEVSMTLRTLPDFMREIRERSDIPNREEAMALALIREEAEIIGLTPEMELRETDRIKGETGLMLRYRPYLKGILIESVYITVRFVNKGYINFSARTFRLTPEMRQELAARQLSRKKIVRIVMDHLEPRLRKGWQRQQKRELKQWRERESQQRWKDRRKWRKPRQEPRKSPKTPQHRRNWPKGEEHWGLWCANEWRERKKCPKIDRLERVITMKPPYLIWIAETVRNYRIDAFTGKILQHISAICPACESKRLRGR